jgi:hypothetical protein
LSSNVQGKKEIKGTKYTNLSTDFSELNFDQNQINPTPAKTNSAIIHKKDDPIHDAMFVIESGKSKLTKRVIINAQIFKNTSNKD